MRWIRYAGLAISVAALASCSVSIPPHVVSGGQALSGDVTLRTGLPTEPAPSALTLGFIAQFERALIARGIHNDSGSKQVLTVAVALAPSGVGETQTEAGKPAEISWIEAPRRRGIFDSCQPERLRVVVNATNESGAIIKRASGEIGACKVGPLEIHALAQAVAGSITHR